MNNDEFFKDELIEEGLKLRSAFSFDYWTKLIKNNELLTSDDYLNDLLPQNNEMFSFMGGSILEDKNTYNYFVEDNKRKISVMVNNVKIPRQIFTLDTLFNYVPSDDVIYIIEQIRDSQSSFKYLPFFMYLPNDLKKNQRFWLDLQNDESYILSKYSCYEVQDSLEMRKVIERKKFGMSLDKYLGMKENVNLSFINLANKESDNFMVLPKEYKEDLAFVKEVLHERVKADKSNEKLWLQLSPELQRNSEIIKLEFSPQKNRELDSLGAILMESNNINVMKDDDLFFDILKIAYSEPVKTSNKKNLFYFCFNNTFNVFFRELVNSDIELTNMSNYEIVECILNKKLEQEMKKDSKVENNTLIIKKTLKF